MRNNVYFRQTKSLKTMTTSSEKKLFSPISGWITVILFLFIFIICCYGTYSIVRTAIVSEPTVIDWLGLVRNIIAVIACAVLCNGNITLGPNEAMVYRFNGKYMGTLRGPGYVVMPFWWNAYSERDLALQTIEVEPIKVNDLSGKPILIGCDIYCKEADTYKATFDVPDLGDFLTSKGKVALRALAMKHPMGGDAGTTSLSGSQEKIVEELMEQVTQAYEKAGYEVDSAAITTLNYAPEIAGVMLQKQQAQATVAARKEILEGAIGMVEEAVNTLKSRGVVEYDAAGKQNFVTSLMVTMCSHNGATPMLEVNS